MPPAVVISATVTQRGCGVEIRSGRNDSGADQRPRWRYSRGSATATHRSVRMALTRQYHWCRTSLQHCTHRSDNRNSGPFDRTILGQRNFGALYESCKGHFGMEEW